jgi:hypothetical protein
MVGMHITANATQSGQFDNILAVKSSWSRGAVVVVTV